MASLSAGSHTLSFVGTAIAGDSGIAIDAVTVGAFVVVGPTTLQSDGSVLGTQAAIDNAQNGWTILVPAGTYIWSSTLNINKDIQLLGAGMDITTIIDENDRTNSEQLINWMTTSNNFDRLSGFTFKGGVTNTQIAYHGSVVIDGTCHAFRLDNCKFNVLFNANVVFNGWILGVVDHCIFWRNGPFGVQIHHYTWDNAFWGDGSWASPDSFGTTNAIYIENCSFTNNYTSGGAIDSEGGGRFVFRYNTLTNDNIGAHGTDSSGRMRSIRSFEIYNNTFYWDTNMNSIWFTACYLRGGTGVMYSNNIYGYNNPIILAAYRDTPGPWVWGNASGQNSWDTNGIGVYQQGSHTGTNNAPFLTDSSVSWVANQWAPTTNGCYMILNTNTGLSSYILSNDVHNIYQYPVSHFGVPMVFSKAQVYQIGFVYRAIDQPGCGPGQLIADTFTGSGIPSNTVTGTASWPLESIDPVYQWGNTVVGLIGNTLYNTNCSAQHQTIVANRDWFDGVPRPGYTNLSYPHPLTLITNSQAMNSATVGSPTISTQPAAQFILAAGQDVSLAVIATGVNLSYSWLYNDTPIADATNSTYTITAAQPTDAGNYSVVVTNPYGSVTSSVAAVRVNSVISTVTPPTGLNVITQ